MAAVVPDLVEVQAVALHPEVVTETIVSAARENYKMRCKRMDFQREMLIISQNSLEPILKYRRELMVIRP